MRMLISAALLALSAVSAQAENRWVTVQNNTDFIMMEFYASNRDQANWGRDWFGMDVLASGESKAFDLDDGSGYCIWDLKAVFDDGDEVITNGFNVCEEAYWTIN